MRSDKEQERRAIAEHSEQAALFSARYSRLAADVYESCFTYSRHRLQVALDRLLPAHGNGLRLLDVGCGTGHHVGELRRRGFEVAGIDGSEAMIAHARANNPGVLLARSEVDAIPFASESFDFVLCIEVLRYLPRISSCLREMARVLKPGGACLATATPRWNLNGYWLINRLACAVPVPGVVRLKQYFVTSSGLREELWTIGFGKVEIQGVYFGPLNWVERLAPRLVPRVLRKWERVDAWLADRALVGELSNMFLIRAKREAERG